jgi:hypothetical protein
MGGGAGGAAARWPFANKGHKINFRLIIQRPNNRGCLKTANENSLFAAPSEDNEEP